MNFLPLSCADNAGWWMMQSKILLRTVSLAPKTRFRTVICFRRAARRAATILFTIQRRSVKKQLAFHFRDSLLASDKQFKFKFSLFVGRVIF